MLVVTYGLYDKEAKNFVRTFTSQNDKTAERASKYIVREQNFDPISGCYLVVMHLFDFDSSTGQVVNNELREICDLKTAYEQFIAEKERTHGQNK